MKYLNLYDYKIYHTNLQKFINVRKYIEENHETLYKNIFLCLGKKNDFDIANVLKNLAIIHYDKKMQNIIYRILDNIYQEKDINIISEYLLCIRNVINIKRIERKALSYVFDQLLYFDNDDMRVRCYVYEILGDILEDYYEMDLFIQNKNKITENIERIKDLEMAIDSHKAYDISKDTDTIEKLRNQIEELKIKNKNIDKGYGNDIYCQEYIDNNIIEAKNSDSFDQELQKNNISKESIKLRICDHDYRSFDNDNLNVLVAKIWNDLKDEKEDFEFLYTLRLLNKIIKLTHKFCQNRIQKEGFLEYIIKNHSSKKYNNDNERYNVFYNFLILILDNLKMNDKGYELMFSGIIDVYSINRNKSLVVLSKLKESNENSFNSLSSLIEINSEIHRVLKEIVVKKEVQTLL